MTGLATVGMFTRGYVRDVLVCLLSIMQYLPCLSLLYIVVEQHMNVSLNLMWQPRYVLYTEGNYTKVQKGLSHVRYLYGRPVDFRINDVTFCSF